MTIINSLVQGDRAYLLTDMAWTETATGRIYANSSKLVLGHNFPWAIAVTGDAYHFELANQISWRAPANAREMVEALPLLLRGLQTLSANPTFTMALRLAAWCDETGRARVFHVDMDAERCALWGITPWQVVEAPVLIPGEGIVAALPDIDLSPEALQDASRFDPERDGVQIVAAQRQHVRFPPKGRSEPMVLMGCGVELATIGRTGVSTKVLHTWPEDRIGELILPA